MSKPCLEIVTYQSTNPVEADDQRQLAATIAAKLPGFTGWLPLTDSAEPGERADVVGWTSQEAAHEAAKQVGAAEEFAPFRRTVDQFKGMGHFELGTGGLPFMQDGDGVELGQFRLRDGVTEAALRSAHTRMVEQHLSQQTGWCGQRLLKLKDGIWVDLAFAQSQETAETICASWSGNKDCEAFLEMIEPVSMQFGAIA